MSVGYYEDRVTSHPARVALVEAQELATRAAGPSFEDPDLDVLEHAEAARAAVDDVVSRIDLADPQLISDGMLSDLNRPALRIRDFLNDFLSDPGSASIQDVRAELERLLTAARGLPPSPWQAEADVVRGAATRFRDRVAGLRREAEQRIDQLKQEGEAIGSDLRSDLAEAESRLQQLQLQANTSEEAAERRSEELNNRLSGLQDRAENIASAVGQTFVGMEERFGSTQQSREERFGQAGMEQEQRFSGRVGEWENEWEDEWQQKKTTLDADSSAMLAELEELLAEAKRVLSFSAAASTYEANASEAQRQEARANQWRWIGIGALMAAAGVAIGLLVVMSPPDNMNLASMFVFFLPRLGITSFMGAIAAYAIREAGRHRERERLARQAAVDIASFRPFLAELPEDERNEEVRHAARRQFFHGVGGSELDGLT